MGSSRAKGRVGALPCVSSLHCPGLWVLWSRVGAEWADLPYRSDPGRPGSFSLTASCFVGFSEAQASAPLTSGGTSCHCCPGPWRPCTWESKPTWAPVSLPYRYWPSDPHGGPSGVSEGAERALRAGGLSCPWRLALGAGLPSLCRGPGGGFLQPPAPASQLCLRPAPQHGVLEILYILGFPPLFIKPSTYRSPCAWHIVGAYGLVTG